MTIAFWCVLVALLLPYAWYAVVNAKGGKNKDNNDPRDFLQQLDGAAKRAWGAHLNSFEANIGYVAGVVIAHLAHAPQGRIDLLAVIFVACRILYGILYIAGVGSLRSVVWGLGLVCTIALFAIGA